VVEWKGTLVEFLIRYDDFDRVFSHGGLLEQTLSFDSAVQTRHILHTIRERRRNGQYILVLETSTRWLDYNLQILQASL
jgi:hypothetical protein